MIQQQTVLRVVDNSGAKAAKCIKIDKGFKKRYSVAGNIITVSIKRLRNKFKEFSKVKKGEIYKALILRTKKSLKKKDGSLTQFKENCVTLITKQNNPISTKIFGPVPKSIRRRKFKKILNLSSGLV